MNTKPQSSLRKLTLAWSASETEPGTLRVAFASRDRVCVDQHFGAAEGFAIYAVDAEHAYLAGVVEFPPESMDGNENKLAEKISALTGCAAVYCLAVGGSAVRQLVAAEIQPIRLDEPQPIETLLNAIRNGMSGGGIPWIDKALRKNEDTGRFDRMADEGWQE